MPEIFGFKVEAPRLPTWNEVRSTVSQGVNQAGQISHSVAVHARNLGQQGLDLGRRAIANPDRAVRELASAARSGIHHVEKAAQTGIRDGVMWTGRQVHAGAEVARHSIRGNGVVAQAARGLITSAEHNVRFRVGVVGGLAKEAVGLVGTVGTIGTSVAELQLSRSARAEFSHKAASLAHQGGAAVSNYARAVVADPSRVGRDVQAAGAATEKAVSGFVGSETKRYGEAFKRGEGIETVGMTTGQILSYVIPVGAGGKAAATAARGVEGLAAGGAERLIAKELTIAAAGAKGNPAAIVRGLGELSTRQANVLARLDTYGSQTVIGKAFNHNDLAALTAATGHEFAMFTTGGRRLIVRGDAVSVPVNVEIAQTMAAKGWRFSAHTHPGVSNHVLIPSAGDKAVLDAMGGARSAILNSRGDRQLFTPSGLDLQGWKPR